MNVVLFQPITQEGRYTPYIPWSIIYAPLYLFYDNRVNVVLIDQNTERSTWKQKVKQAVEEGVLCAGVSSLTGATIYNGLEFSGYVKSFSKDIPIIWGGVHPTALPEQTLSHEYVDIVIRNEGEITLKEVVDSLLEGHDLSAISGISYKKNGSIIHNEDRPFLNLNDLPTLPLSKIDLKKYITRSHIVHNQKLSSVQFFLSRGCPEKCRFCYNKMFNKGRYRSLNTANVVTTIESFLDEAKNQNVFCNHIWFPDDHLFVSTKQLTEMCESLKSKNIRISWSAYFHLNLIRKFSNEFLLYLRENGLIQLYCGVESGSERILGFIQKRISIPLVYEINRKLKAAEIPVKYSFMGGFPSETEQELQQTVDVMLDLTSENPLAETTRINIFCPYPGTELQEIMVREYDYQPPQDLVEWIHLNKFLLYKNTWLSSTMKKRLQMVSILSYFFDTSKYKFERIKRILFLLYRPIAILRARKRWYWNFLDTYLLLLLQKWRLRV